MSSRFTAPPIRPAWPRTPRRLIEVLAKHVGRFLYILCRPLIPYESTPREPNAALPEEAGDLTDEQLAQCQAIFDQCETRCAHIEKKAQWTFTIFAFLIPALASVLVLLIRDPAFSAANGPLSLVLLSVSVCLLILSFLSGSPRTRNPSTPIPPYRRSHQQGDWSLSGVQEGFPRARPTLLRHNKHSYE